MPRKRKSIVEEATTLEVKPDEVIWLMQEMTAKRDEVDRPDFYTALAILMGRYPKQSAKVFAISERMRCLTFLCEDPRMRGWAIEDPDDPGCQFTSEAVFAATALAPLHSIEGQLQFNADEFFAIVLEQSPSEGNS